MNKVKLNRKTINIKVNDHSGKETSSPVTAWVYGDILAFYKGITGQWVLTHVPTGLKVGDYEGKYSGLRTLMAILVSLKIDWTVTEPVTLLNHLDFNRPYDAYRLIKLLLCDVIDLDEILTLITEHGNVRSVLVQIDKILLEN